MQKRHCSIVAYLFEDRKSIKILASCAELSCWVKGWVVAWWVGFKVFRTFDLISQSSSIWCVHQLSDGEPFIFVDFKAALNELLEVNWYFGPQKRWFQYLLLEFNFSCTILQWSISMKKLVNNNSQSPNISFWSILVVNQTLRTHVNGTTDIEVFEFFFIFDCKSKVGNFGTSVLGKEDIR